MMYKKIEKILEHSDVCPLPCASMTVFFQMPIIGKGPEDKAYIKFYLKNKIKVSTSRFSYTILSFLAEVGGYIGLLLGVSLLDIPTVIDRIFAMSKNQKQ